MRIFTLALMMAVLCSFSGYAQIEKLVILGSGPAGLTSAIFAGQLHLDPLIVEGKPCDSQLDSIHRIENYPGFPEGISGPELNARLHLQAEIFGARFLQGEAIKVDLKSHPFHIQLENGHEIVCESLIIATGSSARKLGLKKEDRLLGNGINTNALCETSKFQNKNVVVVGGGDSALEQALFLTDYASKITLVYRGKTFPASPYLQERINANPKIEVMFNTVLVDIRETEDHQHVQGVLFRNLNTQEESSIDCEEIIVAIGRQPNTHLFQGQLELTKDGYIITQPNATKTPIAGVFVAGDIVADPYRKITTATASGCKSALDAKNFINHLNE